MDLSILQDKAAEEYLSQPVKGEAEEHTLLAKPIQQNFNFLTTEESDLEQWVL